MLLVLGLGNPQKKHENTRHNVGFMAIQKIKEVFGFPEFEFNSKFKAEISKGKINGRDALLAKPQTFMNSSGEAVIVLLDFYKISAGDLIVIHDDLDIALGEMKTAFDSRSAGHNGVQNIIDRIGTQKFRRIRIGIKPSLESEEKKDASDFVLEEFSEKELEKIQEVLEEVVKEIEREI